MAEAVPRLIEAAEREEDDSVRLAIALALADLEDPRAADTLWALFESGTVPIRQAALQGLGRLGDDRIIPVAMAWCTSQDRLSRAIGAFDLALLQTARGEEALSELLAAEPSWRRRRSIQRSIRRARRWRSNHRR
jgi:HEAT repeat protein